MNTLTLADWGGSAAAAVAICFLFKKSLGYWYFSIVATTLWFYVLFETDSLMAAGLQVFYTVFALYGIARWHLEKRGRRIPRRLDDAGAALAVAVFGATIVSTDFNAWPAYLEFAAVALSILANWLTALKVIWCWPLWISTNVLFALLFFELRLWGLFTMQFFYAALSLVGWYAWSRDRVADVSALNESVRVIHA